MSNGQSTVSFQCFWRDCRFYPRHVFSTCRMIPIQSSRCSPDPGEAFTYSQHVCKYYRNFLRSYEVSQFALKAVTTRIFYPIGSLATVILEKSLLAYKKSRHFFSTCRMTLIQNALCFPDPGEAFTYSQHVCKYYRNFLRSYEVNQFALWRVTTRMFYLVDSSGHTDFGKILTS